MMEFTFGLFLGAGIGYAAWLSRNELKNEKEINDEKMELGLWQEMLFIFIISLFVYLLFPALIEPLADRMSYDNGVLSGVVGDILRIFVNYAFYGFALVLIVIYKRELAWQIGITLTFCHTIIDLIRDLRPEPDMAVNLWIQLIIAAVITMIVAYLVAKYKNGKSVNNSMFQILVWSTITIAFASLGFDLLLEGGLKEAGFANLIVRTFFVHVVFLSSAIYASYMSGKISKTPLH